MLVQVTPAGHCPHAEAPTAVGEKTAGAPCISWFFWYIAQSHSALPPQLQGPEGGLLSSL